MTLDLTEARRLHDRNPNDPRYCATCGTFNDPAGTYPVKWPCPTATALGATGRSEWSNTVREDECSNDPRCTLANHHPGHCTTPNDPDTPTGHATFNKPGWEYTTTTGPRKNWEDADTPPAGKNGLPDLTWERNTDAGRNGWERFDHTEESYWRRPKTHGDNQ